MAGRVARKRHGLVLEEYWKRHQGDTSEILRLLKPFSPCLSSWEEQGMLAPLVTVVCLWQKGASLEMNLVSNIMGVPQVAHGDGLFGSSGQDCTEE